ncbi:DUF802 domain-containing protein [Marinobacter fonticola]|uniref:DUF802 domain-containing protein n=1 Tax=Marinobacter fonticola TaxID=2603215 RepID=UPI0011E6A21A|nr:DUF802 domain-containing protein [Marinobacter fonticola]
MSKLFFTLAFAIGIAVVVWVGAGFIGTNPLALAFTGLIALIFGLGFTELAGFRGTTARLSERLDDTPTREDQLGSWLDGLPEPIQFAVQRRLEGYDAALPGPQLTPYLTGLLVMLGLLGTFAGMIVTLGGAASALDGSTELSAIRSALAAPIAGLSLAFGTSIAGVAASAMLGLASTLSRRDRLQISRKLDRNLRQKLHHLSADFQRHQAFTALQSQAKALPELATTMGSLLDRMEHVGQRLEQSLTQNQQEFHDTVGNQYRTLADTVAQSLKDALDASSRQAAERIEPIVSDAMIRLRDDAGELHRSWSSAAESKIGHLAEAFQTTTIKAGERWQHNLEAQQQASEEHRQALEESSEQSRRQMLELIQQWLSDMQRHQQEQQDQFHEQVKAAGEQLQRANEHSAEQWRSGLERLQTASESLLQDLGQTLLDYQNRFNENTDILIGNQKTGLERLTSTISEQLSALHAQEADQAQVTHDRLETLEATAARHLTELGTALEVPMTRLIETASETPKAAAEIIRQLQTEIARNSERENELLEERQRLLQQLDSLLETQRTQAESQRDAVDTLITGASETLDGISGRFNALVQEQSQQLVKLAEDVTGSSQEVGALSEAFQTAVELFSTSNTQLQQTLADMQHALGHASSRHDEQLAYYVAQAREVIDLSVSSQKDVIDAVAALQSASPASSEAR